MFYLKDIKSGKYIAITKRRGSPLTAELRDTNATATFWQTLDAAAFALGRLEELEIIGRMTATIVKED